MATDFGKLKVTELKAELKRLGLPQNGLKAELVARLEAAVNEPNVDDDDAPDVELEDAQEPIEEEPAMENEDLGDQDDIKATNAKEVAPMNSEPLPTSNGNAAMTTTTSSTTTTTATDDTIHGEVTPRVEATTPTAETAPATLTQEPANLEHQSQTPQVPSSSSATPLRPAEIIQDSQKRKRRSQSPDPKTEDIVQKRAKVEEGLQETVQNSDHEVVTDASQNRHIPGRPQSSDADVEMGNTRIGGPAETHVDVGSKDLNDDQMNVLGEEPYEQPQPISHDTPMTELQPTDTLGDEMEYAVEPSIHPATSALYIKNFMRPLRPQAVQDHLLDLATPANQKVDDSTISAFYLDTIRTHAFVVFNSISAASRVRTTLHNRVWPDETNRKALWVDYIPPEKFDIWVDMEQSSDRGRGSMNRFEVTYDRDDRDDGVVARLEDVGAAPPAASRQSGPTFQEAPERNAPIPTGPRAGVEGAPLGPRAFGSSRPSQALPSRLERLGASAPGFSDDSQFTRASPSVPYQAVHPDLADRRLATLRAAKSKQYSPERDPNKEYKRYFFEQGTVLVDRGPEIFLGIRPPHREREKRRDDGRSGPWRGGRMGGGTSGGRKGRRFGGGGGAGGAGGGGGGGMPMHHGVPRGGDRYRGAAAEYDEPEGREKDRDRDRDRGSRFGSERGGSRFRGDNYGRF